MQPAVAATGLHHVHASGRVGLAGVDVAVPPGQRVVVLGPNGSGKTTLLRVISTALRPDRGTLRLLGRAVPPAPPGLRARLGVLPDRPAHLEPLTGRENALLFAAAAGVPRREAEARLPPLFERLALADAAADPVSAWSMGMGRKLLLVEALLHEPALLVLDEPSIGLDPPGVDALVALLEERAAAGTAVVAALNDPVVAARIADRVLMLDDGRVVADAPPRTLLEELGRGVRCRIEVGGRTPEDAARLLDRVTGVAAEALPGGVEARLDGGASLLPGVVAALVEAGVEIRTLGVREPDLRDVFRARTGRALTPGATP